ncbi:rhomboid family intramembrane serine protease [Candidatus Arthromitus sp. SFB-rat-Yit]|uniref:rhomboid family intramembrane serine protease n=1 Tax=Candidatus Arthromitus sp. SFB-rat-Yit TaxID=1041504 RepID=UPI000227A269|nr:rhomboid family intramembrane serine protease [Candidatus Arthromitus sp. SFB-rat-Yit]BAK80791.1 putative rhomboid family protein [Candidatus Arthromitus sp. SFB-rat-Yit]
MENENYNLNIDTIKIDKDDIVNNLIKKRPVFTNNEAFPWMIIGSIVIYISFYILLVYGKKNLIDVDLGSLNLLNAYTGNDIVSGNYFGAITNIFIHRSLWDLINTIFILVFCGFFMERYIKRSVIVFVYVLSIISFNLISIFMYSNQYYLGSFTIVSSLIGMCIYFCYRFRRFILKIDIYIYISLMFIGFFISYMVDFYSLLQFLASYLIGVFVMFILDTKCLRNNK